MSRSQLEIFRDTMEHKSHKDFLFYAELSQAIREKLVARLGMTVPEIVNQYGMFHPVNVAVEDKEKSKLRDKTGLYKYYSDIEIPENASIDHIGVLRIPTGHYHFFKRVSPLRNAASLEDLESFSYPNADCYDLDIMKALVEKAHSQGKVAVCVIGHMYESAWQIRGYESFLMDMIAEPEMCEFILDRLCERNTRLAELAALAGADYIRTGDDVANQRTLMFDINMWRRFIKSRWEKAYSAAKKINPNIKVWYHSDGNIMEIIPELIEIGVDILNPIQPECLDAMEVKRLYGDKLVLDGTIGTQSTMPFGTPEEVRTLIKERKRTFGYDGGLIISPTHLIEPDVPIENVIAFLEECKNL